VKRSIRIASVALAAGLVLSACASDEEATDAADPAAPEETVTVDPAQTEGGLLAAVQERGTLICGVSQGLPGFSIQGDDGTYTGFDVDYCRAVAAAVLGDADAVDFVELSASARFTALQAGEIDVLIRNTTWTATRDRNEGGSFAATTFYDGQGMMVDTDSGFDTIDDMANTTICVQAGTTTQLNLESPVRRARPAVHGADLRGQRPAAGGLLRGPLRRLDLRPLAARRVPWHLAGRAGWRRVGEDPAGRHLQGAPRPPDE